VLFVELMTIHHAGAFRTADEELRNGSDPLLRTMAYAIRHEQQGEIALMSCPSGGHVVLLAVQHRQRQQHRRRPSVDSIMPTVMPIRGSEGAEIIGPRNADRERQNPFTVRSPASDHGTMPNLKWSFADSHMRIEERGWARDSSRAPNFESHGRGQHAFQGGRRP
jgi:hypothetical protein